MHGYFVAGKYDQFQRNVPGSAITAAFRNLVQMLLMEGNQELAAWRTALLDALGPNGRLIIDVIPEVAMIIGDQPPVQTLGPVETQNRFNLVFQSFFRAFCRPERPLVLFLDDLQWVDSASLQILEAILSDDQAKHFFGSNSERRQSKTLPLGRSLSRQ
jgi:predicted ATPase